MKSLAIELKKSISPAQGGMVWSVAAKADTSVLVSRTSWEANKVGRKTVAAGLGGLVVISLLAYLLTEYPTSTWTAIAIIIIVTFLLAMRS